MKNIAKLLVSIGVLASMALAQTAALAPLGIQFLDSNGAPLSGGLVSSFLAGTSTQAATYTSSSGSTQNSNPVVLDAGGNGTIFILSGTAYKFSIARSNGIIIRTLDGITATVPTPGGSTWTTSGINIFNSNAGNVGVGCSSPTSKLDVCGTSSGSNYVVRIEDAANSPGINLIGSGSSLLGSITADSSSAFRVRSANNASQLFVTQGGVTIQDQTPSGTTTLIVENGAGQGTNHVVSIRDALASELAFVDSSGFFVSPLFNSTATGSNAAFQTSLGTFIVSGSGNVGGQVANFNSYQVASTNVIDSSRNGTFVNLTVTGTCTGCGGGGGGSPGGVTNSIQTQNVSGGFGGNANFLYDGTTVTLAGTGSFLTSGISSGFAAGNCTSTACIQAPLGGVTALRLITSGDVAWAENGSPILSIPGFARIYDDPTAHKLMVSANGGAYAPMATTSGSLTNGHCVSINSTGDLVDAGGACTTGGGGGTVASASQYQQAFYTSAGTGTVVGGSPNLTFNSSTQQETITGIASTAALTVINGYIQVDGGVATTSTSQNAFNALSGGVTANALVTSGSVFWVATGAPALSTAGTAKIYFDSGSNILKASQNGGAFVALIGGGGSGVTSLNSLTGVLNITNGSTSNQITVAPSGSSIALTIPQGIGTSSAVTFGTVSTAGVFNSGSTGSAAAFQTAAGSFVVNGNGNVGGQVANFNSYQVASTNVIDSSRNGTFANLTVTGTCTGCGGGGGVSSLTGTANRVTVSASTGAVTIGGPQDIATSSSPSFANVTASTSFGSNNTSSGVCSFQNNNVSFCVNGTGGVNAAKYQILGTDVIDGSRNLININQLNVTSGSTVQVQANFTGSGGRLVVNNTSGTLTTSLGATTGVQTTVALQTYTSGFGSLINNINSSGISSTAGFIANGHTGITGSTCSHWTFGLCDTP